MSRKQDPVIPRTSPVTSYDFTEEEFKELNELLGNPEEDDFLKAVRKTKKKLDELSDNNKKAVDAGKKTGETIKKAEKKANDAEAAQKKAEKKVSELEKEIEKLKSLHEKEVKDLKNQLAAATGVGAEERDLGILSPTDLDRYNTLADEAYSKLEEMSEIFEKAAKLAQNRRKASRFSTLC